MEAGGERQLLRLLNVQHKQLPGLIGKIGHQRNAVHMRCCVQQPREEDSEKHTQNICLLLKYVPDGFQCACYVFGQVANPLHINQGPGCHLLLQSLTRWHDKSA